MAEFRENHDLLARLTDVSLVAIKSEKSTSDSAPAATLTNLARALEDGRRYLLLARGGTAEKIRDQVGALHPPTYAFGHHTRLTRDADAGTLADVRGCPAQTDFTSTDTNGFLEKFHL